MGMPGQECNMDAFFNCSKNGVFFYLLITWRENYIELNGLFGQNIEKILKKRSSIPVIWSSTSEKLWVHELWSKKEPKKAILLGAKKCYMRKRVCFSSTFSFFGLWFCTLIKQLLGVLLWAIIPFQTEVGSKKEPIYSTRSQIFVRPQKPAFFLKWVD